MHSKCLLNFHYRVRIQVTTSSVPRTLKSTRVRLGPYGISFAWNYNTERHLREHISSHVFIWRFVAVKRKSKRALASGRSAGAPRVQNTKRLRHAASHCDAFTPAKRDSFQTTNYFFFFAEVEDQNMKGKERVEQIRKNMPYIIFTSVLRSMNRSFDSNEEVHQYQILDNVAGWFFFGEKETCKNIHS